MAESTPAAPAAERRGCMVTLEGIDGAGKSTHIETARAAIAARGHPVVVTREPGGTGLGERLRELVLHEPMSVDAEVLLMFAARREHLERVIWPALARGDWVLCDRFTDATFAYQGGGREVGAARIALLADWVHPGFAPHLTLLFDVPVEVGLRRLGGDRALDRFEREQAAFFERVRSAYLALAARDPHRFRLIDGTRAVGEVAAEVAGAIAAL